MPRAVRCGLCAGPSPCNTAYVFTLPPKLADPTQGPRPAPELARYDKTATASAAGPVPAAQPAGTRDALSVLADVLERDGQQLSASQTWQQALTDADHLAILHAIWTAETTPARDQRYKDLLMTALPPPLRRPDRRGDGRPQGPDRPPRCRACPSVGGRSPRPGSRTSGRPAGLAAAGQLHRRLPGTVRLRPSCRPDRPRTRRRWSAAVIGWTGAELRACLRRRVRKRGA